MTAVPRSFSAITRATSSPVTATWGRKPIENILTRSFFLESERAR
jgi:hypothetical protein